MSRSLLTQLEQIRNSATYDDSVASVATQSVAEPTISGSLEGDLNVLRTILKTVKGTTKWYDDLGQYFDPTNTTSGNASLKDFNMSNIKGYTVDAQTVIVPVSADNDGSAYTVSGTQDGMLVTLNAPYATWTDRRGVPIYSSVASGTLYSDIGGPLNVCKVDIISASNNAHVTTSGGDIIYGLMYDAADYSGTRDQDVYVKFFADGSPVGFPSGYETTVTVISGAYSPPSGDDVNFDFSGGYVTPSGNMLQFDFTDESVSGGIKIIYPRRRIMKNMEEWDWFRTDFVNKWEGDVELAEDLSNLWGYTGATDGDPSADPWTTQSGNVVLAGPPVVNDLFEAFDEINTSIGDLSFTESNYISDGTDLATALDALDQQINDNANALTAGAEEKFTEEASTDITKNTVHQLPVVSGTGQLLYTPNATSYYEGANMDVFLNGQLLMADTGASGANADRDYAEVSASGIMFRFNVYQGDNIIYRIRQ